MMAHSVLREQCSRKVHYECSALHQPASTTTDNRSAAPFDTVIRTAVQCSALHRAHCLCYESASAHGEGRHGLYTVCTTATRLSAAAISQRSNASCFHHRTSLYVRHHPTDGADLSIPPIWSADWRRSHEIERKSIRAAPI